MNRWFDAHNHLQDPRFRDRDELVAVARDAGVSGGVVNAVDEADWPRVAAMANDHPDWVRPAYGIHPWRAHQAIEGWSERLRQRLDADPRSVVGEIGLDGWVDEPGLDVQREVFIQQLRLARELDRPAMIHCLKAWGALFEVFDECPPPGKWLLHSFNGSIEVARHLIPMGAYFSLSGYFLRQRKAKVVEVFRQLPRERILLETDAPDMLPPAEWVSHELKDGLNHPANLPSIGDALAQRLGMPAGDLAWMSQENAGVLLG